ncbi:16S rRNA (guanine(966)-N(2))-methyltransferase RsmD [Dethiothermospora halolimnae]|uniref:16S rRNA (guanine(966)-N(2))-methyltransferase RsmD n=1 Tax=Dethiothermospora halolimnae TaxID=3114390 RepID=UPI003CCC36EB
MRVITGIAKGHRLKAPKGLKTRPTTDRVKESIFNILGSISPDALILDLFSGSGNVGIEFLSRGGKECYFIDSGLQSIKTINENLKNTRLNTKGQVYKNNVNRAIGALGNNNKRFDYIFMDPPYEKDLVIPTLEKIYKQEILKKSGIIIIEHETKKILPDSLYNLIKFDMRNYGGTSVTFYSIEED